MSPSRSTASTRRGLPANRSRPCVGTACKAKPLPNLARSGHLGLDHPPVITSTKIVSIRVLTSRSDTKPPRHNTADRTPYTDYARMCSQVDCALNPAADRDLVVHLDPDASNGHTSMGSVGHLGSAIGTNETSALVRRFEFETSCTLHDASLPKKTKARKPSLDLRAFNLRYPPIRAVSRGGAGGTRRAEFGAPREPAP